MSLAAFFALLVGCASCKSPYDYVENWAIRDDPVRPFMVNADVIYVQGRLLFNLLDQTSMQIYADSEVGNGRFGGIARVFSPYITNAADLELALKWYFDHQHEKGRSFVFIGEGEGGRLLKAYHTLHNEELLEMGLVDSFYTDSSNEGFVSAQMVKEIKASTAAARYKAIWGREMPHSVEEERP